MKIIISAFLLFFAYAGLAQSEYNFNQNFQTNSFIIDGSFKKTYGSDSYGKYTLTKISIGRKDAEGNEVFCLRMIKPKSMGKSADTLDLFPDNMYYPTHFKAVEHDYGFQTLKEEYVIINGGLIASIKAERSNAEKNGSASSPKNFAIDLKLGSNYEFKGKGKGQMKSSKEWYEFIDVRKNEGKAWSSSRQVSEYKGIGKYLDARNSQLDMILGKAKKLGYAKLLGDIISEETLFIYDGDADIIKEHKDYWKLVAEKDGNGAVTSLKVHKPFKDGKFYDKENMYMVCTKNKNGLYEFTYDRKTWQVIPFQGYILLGYFDPSKQIIGQACLAKKIDDGQGGHIVDIWAHNLANGKYSTFGDDSSADWWCKRELIEEYNPNKDQYTFSNFIKQYIKNLTQKD